MVVVGRYKSSLSRGSLRFGSTEMSWDCYCFGLRESGIDHFNGMETSMEMLKPYSTACQQLSYYSWYGMVFLFTKRLLKYDIDKMPELSGSATEVSKFQNGAYYASLRWEDMASGMLWFTGRVAELNKPSEYLAPSCSWRLDTHTKISQRRSLCPFSCFASVTWSTRAMIHTERLSRLGSIYPRLSSSWSSVKPQTGGGSMTMAWTRHWGSPTWMFLILR